MKHIYVPYLFIHYMMNSINFYYFTIPYVFLLNEVETRFDHVSDSLNIRHGKLQKVVTVATIHVRTDLFQYQYFQSSNCILLLNLQYTPFVQKTLFENGTKIYEGILFEMMNVIAKRLNFT